MLLWQRTVICSRLWKWSLNFFCCFLKHFGMRWNWFAMHCWSKNFFIVWFLSVQMEAYDLIWFFFTWKFQKIKKIYSLYGRVLALSLHAVCCWLSQIAAYLQPIQRKPTFKQYELVTSSVDTHNMLVSMTSWLMSPNHFKPELHWNSQGKVCIQLCTMGLIL